MIYRVERKENPFVQVDKGFINDTNLGYKEKGILLYFLSKPDGWKFYEEEITAHSHDGLTSVRTGIQSLIKTGYIERRQIKAEHGKFAGYEYIVHETSPMCDCSDTEKPFSENPITENPITDIPISENRTLINNKENKNELINNELKNRCTDEKPKENQTNQFCGHEFPEKVKEAVTDWISYKSERREGYKPTGLKMFMSEIENKLKRYEEQDVISIISESMANNWKGICWEKLQGKEKPEEPVERPVPKEILEAQERHRKAMEKLAKGECCGWEELVP